MDKQKILIVDDKEENLYSRNSTLKEVDAEIIKASCGNEALISILNHDFALAILDVQMPDMNGYELAEFIRNENETRYLPIIFLSAVCSDQHHIFKGYETGAVDFITKPYEPLILINKVKVFIELERQKNELMERLIRQEKLAAIGQISGNIAHELRNPLGAIKQSIFFLNRLLEQNRLESSGPKLKEHFGLINNEINKST